MSATAQLHNGREDETSLASRAAWLHYVGRLSQAEVAERLHVPNSKAHRLIARAVRDGLVQVFVSGNVERCMQFERDICRVYGLGFCTVVPDLDDDDLPLRALGVAGARFLQFTCERGETAVIGIGNGRTLAACIDCLPRLDMRDVCFVSLLGGFTRRFAANPFDVMNRIAERMGADAYGLPVPFCVNSVEDRAVMMAQRGVEEVYALARKATLHLVGIGVVDSRVASLATSGLIEEQEFEEVAAAGGKGELLGQFFDARGRRLDIELSSRITVLPLDELCGGRIVAVAGGRHKTAAIRAVLSSGRLHGLITDERTASTLVDAPGAD